MASLAFRETILTSHLTQTATEEWQHCYHFKTKLREESRGVDGLRLSPSQFPCPFICLQAKPIKVIAVPPNYPKNASAFHCPLQDPMKNLLLLLNTTAIHPQIPTIPPAHLLPLPISFSDNWPTVLTKPHTWSVTKYTWHYQILLFHCFLLLSVF